MRLVILKYKPWHSGDFQYHVRGGAILKYLIWTRMKVTPPVQSRIVRFSTGALKHDQV